MQIHLAFSATVCVYLLEQAFEHTAHSFRIKHCPWNNSIGRFTPCYLTGCGVVVIDLEWSRCSLLWRAALTRIPPRTYLLCFGAYVTSNKASFEQMRCFNQFFMIFLSEPFISKEVSKNKKNTFLCSSIVNQKKW